MADTPTLSAAAPPPDEWVERAFLVLTESGAIPASPKLRALLESQLVVAGSATRAQTFSEFARSVGAEIAASYNPVDPAVVAWARDRSSALVVQVTDATRRGIAEVVASELQAMSGVPATQRKIRARLLADRLNKGMGHMAGLDANRIRSVLRYEEGLLEAGYSAADAQRMAGTYAKRQLRDRAKVIAQTEMRRSVETVQRDTEKEMGAKEKRWSTVGDNRVSEQDANNEAGGWIGIDAAFRSGHTEPPGHPRCRCTVEYRGESWENTLQKLRDAGAIQK